MVACCLAVLSLHTGSANGLHGWRVAELVLLVLGGAFALHACFCLWGPPQNMPSLPGHPNPGPRPHPGLCSVPLPRGRIYHHHQACPPNPARSGSVLCCGLVCLPNGLDSLSRIKFRASDSRKTDTLIAWGRFPERFQVLTGISHLYKQQTSQKLQTIKEIYEFRRAALFNTMKTMQCVCMF